MSGPGRPSFTGELTHAAGYREPSGYRPGLEPLVGHLGVLDAHGAPRVIDGEALPGLRSAG